MLCVDDGDDDESGGGGLNDDDDDDDVGAHACTRVRAACPG